MSDKDETMIVEEPAFDWTQWAEPLTADEEAELPSQEELAEAAKRGIRDA